MVDTIVLSVQVRPWVQKFIMKATLEFDMDNVDDKRAHLRCVKSTDMAIILFDIIHNLKRKMISDNTPPEYIEGVDDTINQVLEMCEDFGVNITNSELID
jgi:hypothetical protein